MAGVGAMTKATHSRPGASVRSHARPASTTTSARTTRTRSTRARVRRPGRHDRRIATPYLVRIEDPQSNRSACVRQCLKQIPRGRTMVDDPRVSLPPKRDTYNTIESMILHFNHIVDASRVRPEAYAFVEGGQRRLVLHRRGRPVRPYKEYVRSPSFVHPRREPSDHNHFIADNRADLRDDQHDSSGECDK